nr:DUF4259 domain-containing protein [Corynebacterium lactis]
MSVWETEIFSNDSVIELFDELQDLDAADRVDGLIDACRIAVDSGSEDEQLSGVAAAIVAAIWKGAPFPGGDIVEDYSFIREGVADSASGGEELMEAASEVFENLVANLDESTQAFLEDFTEAVE